MENSLQVDEIPITDEICGEIVYKQEERNYRFLCTVCCDESFIDFSGFSKHYEIHHVAGLDRPKKDEDKEVIIETNPVTIEEVVVEEIEASNISILEKDKVQQFVTLDEILNVSENLPPIIFNLDDNMVETQSQKKDELMLPIDALPPEEDTFDIEEFIKFNDESEITTDLDNSENFICKVCKKIFKTKKALWDHSIYHNLQFKCEQCDKAFAKKSLLNRHFRTHSEERPFECEMCEKSFKTTDSLTVHLRCHSGVKTWKCDYCPKMFPTNYSRQVHHQRHLKICQFQCDECKRGFVTKIALEIHSYTHEKKSFPCEFCGKLFDNAWTKKSHEIQHTQTKNQVCDICGERFLRKNTLLQHLKTHQDQKDYKCPVEGCDKSFKQLSTFYIHRNSHSNRTINDEMLASKRKRTTYNCEDCGQKFTRKVLYTQHKKIHNNGNYRNEEDIIDNFTEVQCVDVYTY